MQSNEHTVWPDAAFGLVMVVQYGKSTGVMILIVPSYLDVCQFPLIHVPALCELVLVAFSCC